MLDALGPGNIRDMYQPVNAVLDLDERAEVGQRHDLALNPQAQRITLADRSPRIGNQLLVAEADALAVTVEFEHLDLNRLADLEDLVWILNPTPRHIGDVEQAIESAEI